MKTTSKRVEVENAVFVKQSLIGLEFTKNKKGAEYSRISLSHHKKKSPQPTPTGLRETGRHASHPVTENL